MNTKREKILIRNLQPSKPNCFFAFQCSGSKMYKPWFSFCLWSVSKVSKLHYWLHANKIKLHLQSDSVDLGKPDLPTNSCKKAMALIGRMRGVGNQWLEAHFYHFEACGFCHFPYTAPLLKPFKDWSLGRISVGQISFYLGQCKGLR